MALKSSRKQKKVAFAFGIGEAEAYKNLDNSTIKTVTREDPNLSPLAKSILNVLNGPTREIERLSFQTNPNQNNTFSGVHRAKVRLIPDIFLQRIAIQDSLVATCVRTRQNHGSNFGRPVKDRFSMGFAYKPNTGIIDTLSPEEKATFAKEQTEAISLLSSCGHKENRALTSQFSFSDYLKLSFRDAVVNGRIATEIAHQDLISGEKRFHHFTHVDAATILPASNDQQSLQAIRDEAFHLLSEVTGKTLTKEDFVKGKYEWVQVIDGKDQQVFTTDEMKCKNFFPAGNVDLDGYPVTPIDTVIASITTHINITTHNKLYFQSGRAARGMLIIKSDDIDDTVLNNLKQQFNNNINGASSSHRMPVLGCPTDGEITWQALDASGQRDMEFQYLTDMNAREIISAFMMSPDELPGWAYLSKGTNSQTLAESNNEYKLTAARDVGIRPLLSDFEDFVNENLFPLISPKLAKMGRIVFMGLDAKTAEQEAEQLSKDTQIWMTINDVFQKVEKPLLAPELGGDLPLSEVVWNRLNSVFTVGQIMENFMKIPNASKDPMLAYRRDAFFMQWYQLQQAQQKAAQAPTGETFTQGQNPGSDGKGVGQSPEAAQFGKTINQAWDLMSKSEDNLPPAHRKLLAQHNKTVDFFIKGFEADTKDAIKDIKEMVGQLTNGK